MTRYANPYGESHPPVAVPVQSKVLFMDGFGHYENLDEKWDTASGGSITASSGCYLDTSGLSTLAERGDYHQYVAPYSGTLTFSGGPYKPGTGAPYVEKSLGNFTGQRFHGVVTLKAEKFSGNPFLEFLDGSGNLVVGFCILPDGTPATVNGSQTTNYRYGKFGSMCARNTWIELTCGIGIISPAGATPQGWFPYVKVNGFNISGWDMFYSGAASTIESVRLGPAGQATEISDFVLHRGMFNEAGCVHGFHHETGQYDQAPGGAYVQGTEWDDLNDVPPAGDTIGLIGGGVRDREAWSMGYILEDPTCGEFSLWIAPVAITPEFNWLRVWLTTTAVEANIPVFWYHRVLYYGECLPDWLMNGQLAGLEYQTYPTMQVNAYASGSGMAFGLSGGGIDWDSIYLNRPKDNAFDITQVCHHHSWYRWQWTPISLHEYAIGAIAMNKDVEGQARFVAYWGDPYGSVTLMYFPE